MHHRSSIIVAVPFIALAMFVAGCGGGNDAGGFPDCGNGVVDGDEKCDDGNLADGDSCLSTCQLNVCGDFFINPSVEQCELGGLLGGATCTGLGFTSGTLACSAQCTFDTSRCTGTVEPPTPTPAATSLPSGATLTPAGTASPSSVATPPAVPTPSGTVCQTGDHVVVVASLDKVYGAARIDLVYPPSVNIPGSGTAQTVVDRVHFAVSSGLTTVSDNRVNGDVDDTLPASLVRFSDNPPGPFVTVTFDCVEGQTPPVAGTFTCMVVSASTSGGVAITDEQCAITVQ